MFRVHKTLWLAFKVAFPGISSGSITLDKESEVYLRIFQNENPPCCTIFLLTGLRIYTGEYKAQGPTLCPTEGRALRGPRALDSPV